MNLWNIGSTENERALRFLKNEGKEKSLHKIFKAARYHSLRKDSIDYFKSLAEESGIPYQTLINLYLRDWAANECKLDLKWK